MNKFAFLLLAAVVSGEVINIVPCEDSNPDKCTINEIRVEPCQSKTKCLLKKGANATIAFDFIPHFSASKLETNVVWNSVRWNSVNTDACLDTPCPTTSGQPQTYTTTVPIGKKLPKGTYTFKWEVHDEADSTNSCCFKATVQLPKK